MAMDRVYLVDDDPGVCSAIQRALRQAGYEVRYGADSTALFRAAAEWEPQVVLLDVRLAREDGRDIAKRFRTMYDTPILMLTGEVSVDARITGLEAGADDYLGKPFDNGELVARIRALLRRYQRGDKGTSSGNPILTLEPARRVISGPGGAQETLTELQSNIMAVLLERAGHVVSREDLYALVFRRPWVPSDRSLEVHMCNLRKLLSKVAPDCVEIQSIRHVGYRLVMESESAD